MKKAIICGIFKFPRGSAAANYVQYLALAFQKLDYDVSVICDTNFEFFQESSKEYNYKEIHVIPIYKRVNRYVDYFQYKYGNGIMIKRALRQIKLNQDDVVICYARNLQISKAILKMKKKYSFKSIRCVVEWFTREYFNSDKSFEEYIYDFENITPQFDLIFPISTYIENHYLNKGCRELCLPIMSDCHEFEYLEKKRCEKYNFIFPANGVMKDSLSSMLKCFTLLTDLEREKVELHLCGIKQAQLESILSKDEVKLLANVIIMHGWMKYDELILLYQKMNYLLLAREINQITMSNFPSKVPEVMAYGVVPIVSRVGDYTKYYLEDGVDSIIFDGCSTENCLMALRRAINFKWDDYKALSINARECVEKKFDFNQWTDAIKMSIDGLSS